MTPDAAPLVVGWKEYVDLPGLGVFGIRAKIDTGARTSALHVLGVITLEASPASGDLVELSIAVRGRLGQRQVTARARLIDRVRVVDSGGHAEVRPLIETDLVLGPLRRPIRVTLTDRSSMLFRMILGRQALAGVLVEPSAKYRLGRRRRPPAAPVADVPTS